MSRKYIIVNAMTEKPLSIIFNTSDRARAFLKKHHFWGFIRELIVDERKGCN